MSRARDFLGSFRLVRLIRAGATCQVWEAVNDTNGRRIAVKALQPELRRDREEMAYLKHEFEVGKGLKHPNVIEIYEYNTDRDTPYVGLELSLGRNMKLMMRDGYDQYAYKIPHLIDHSARGLAYFNDQGWVHRDVKPDNFLVDDDWVVKLIDFALAVKAKTGLGKLFAGKSKIQGTRSYMSPEQIRGKPVDQRSDVYSFGCMVFELLTGKPPFTGTTPTELLNKHLTAGIPTALTANSNVTPEFNELVMKMMAKTPEKRPPSVADFLTGFHNTRVFKAMPKPPAEVADSDNEA